MRVNGRRGVFLLLFGLIHVLLGVSYLLPPSLMVQASLAFLVSLDVPIWTAGIVWVISGGIAFCAGFSPPPRSDGWGFQALISIEVAWAVLYILSWVLEGYSRGWVSASLFLALSGSVYLVSGMISASDMASRGARRDS